MLNLTYSNKQVRRF